MPSPPSRHPHSVSLPPFSLLLHTLCRLQVKALIVENTFTSVEDMVSRILPPLGALIGRGKPLNFLVTNKWYNARTLPKITKVPLLMVISGLVSGA